MGTTSYNTSNFSASLKKPELDTSKINPWSDGVKAGGQMLSATSALATAVPWGTIASGVLSLGAGIWKGVNSGKAQAEQNDKFNEQYKRKMHGYNEDVDNITRAKSAVDNAGFYSNFYAKEGGKLPPSIEIMKDFINSFSTNPKLQQGGQVKSAQFSPEEVDSILTKNKEVPFVNRLLEKKQLPFKGFPEGHKEGGSTGSHYLASMGNYVVPKIQQSGDSLEYFDDKEAFHRAMENNNAIYFEDPQQAIDFAKNYKVSKAWQEFETDFNEKISKHREGGKLNVIPDGALHSRKNTHGDKGVPVVSEKDGVYEKEAEIEKEEIIFSKDLTVWLEDKVAQYQNSEGHLEDSFFIEIGSRLKDELLNNTQDNTKLLKVKK